MAAAWVAAPDIALVGAAGSTVDIVAVPLAGEVDIALVGAKKIGLAGVAAGTGGYCSGLGSLRCLSFGLA
jgi:hypothetical protein